MEGLCVEVWGVGCGGVEVWGVEMWGVECSGVGCRGMCSPFPGSMGWCAGQSLEGRTLNQSCVGPKPPEMHVWPGDWPASTPVPGFLWGFDFKCLLIL